MDGTAAAEAVSATDGFWDSDGRTRTGSPLGTPAQKVVAVCGLFEDVKGGS